MYEERVVAFIDILGFSSLIKNKKEGIDKIIEVVENMQRIAKEVGAEDEPKYDFYYDRQVSVFSDSIVISYKNVGPAEYYLVRELMVLQTILLYNDILVRGGVTIGGLYHKGSVVIGPALINAYEIESKVAIYPRIVFYETSQCDWCMLSEDYDGIFFIDFLGNADEWAYYIEKSEGIEVNSCLTKIYDYINNINDTSDLRVNAKVNWLKKYINESIDKTEPRLIKRLNDKTYRRCIADKT